MEKPDLSFTQDSAWQAQRKERWDAWVNYGLDHVRKKRLKLLEHFFMTGEFKDPSIYGPTDYPKADDGSAAVSYLSYFPLQTKEGYDYLFSEVLSGDGHYCWIKQFFDVLNEVSPEETRFTTEEQRFRWEYFHPDTFQPVIETSAFTDKTKTERFKMEVNALELYEKLLNAYRKPCRYEEEGFKVPDLLTVHWDYMASVASEIQSSLKEVNNRTLRDVPEYISWLVTSLLRMTRDESICPDKLAYINRFLDELAEHSKYYPKKFLMAYHQGLKEGDPQWKKPGMKLPR